MSLTGTMSNYAAHIGGLGKRKKVTVRMYGSKFSQLYL